MTEPSTTDETTDAAAPPPPPFGATATEGRFFIWMREVCVVRQDGWIGGLCSGVALRLGIDPVIVRGITVVVALIGGPAFILYAAGWLLLPDTGGRILLQEMFRGRPQRALLAVAVLLLFSLLPVAQGFWSAAGAYWGQPYWGDSIGHALWTVFVLALVAVVVALVARRATRRASPPSAPPAEPRPQAEPAQQDQYASEDQQTTPVKTPPDDVAAWKAQQDAFKAERDEYRLHADELAREASRAQVAQARRIRLERNAAARLARRRSRSHPLFSLIAIGASLGAGAASALAGGAGSITVTSFFIGLAIALGMLALAIIVNGARGKRAGGSLVVAIVLLVPFAAAITFPQSPTVSYAGNVTIKPVDGPGPTTAHYFSGFGDVTVDLRDYYKHSAMPSAPLEGSDFVRVTVLTGNVRILLPANEYSAVGAFTGNGAITESNSSNGVTRSFFPNGDRSWGNAKRAIILSVQAAAGNIHIVAPVEANGVAK